MRASQAWKCLHLSRMPATPIRAAIRGPCSAFSYPGKIRSMRRDGCVSGPSSNLLGRGVAGGNGFEVGRARSCEERAGDGSRVREEEALELVQDEVGDEARIADAR